MIRKEKEILESETLKGIISQAQVLRLGMCKDNLPYVVPLSFGYDGNCFYFHSAIKGMKIDYFTSNTKVCFELEHGVSLLPGPEKACDWSVSFSSIIGFGCVEEITDPEKKIFALNHIMNHYSQKEKPWNFNSHMLGKTRLWQIKIESMTGKKSH